MSDHKVQISLIEDINNKQELFTNCYGIYNDIFLKYDDDKFSYVSGWFGY